MTDAASGERTMQIIRLIEGHPVTDSDVWVRAGDGDPLPESAPALVSLARWQSERGDLARRNVAVGVRLASDETLEGLTGDLERLDLIALDFPNFNDGRHFTTARLLRERYGFRGEIRATGQVLRDQLFAMARCGFDSFELQPHQDAEAAHRAFREISVVFQPAADGRLAARAIRAGRAAVQPSA
jgi:uncharacterized protein (DUF934 family)